MITNLTAGSFHFFLSTKRANFKKYKGLGFSIALQSMGW